MSEFICKNCQALLGVGNVYCLNCGTPVTESIEQETVIRTKSPRVIRDKRNRTLVGAIAALLTGVGVIGGLFVFAKYQDEQVKNQRDQEDRIRANKPANAPPKSPPPPTTKPTIERVEVTPQPTTPERIDVFKGTLRTSIGVGQEAKFSFTAEKNGELFGRLEGEGGLRGEYDAFLLHDRQYIEYKNDPQRSVPTIWSTNGKVVVAEIKGVKVIAGERYHLLIINPSGWTGRTVHGGIELR
jgi:hypothetical protein